MPVPFALAQQIRSEKLVPLSSPRMPPPIPTITAASARPVWGRLAAGLVILMLGGVGGYLAKDLSTPAQVRTAGWLEDIADYHAVYAGQTRHLVEVGADQSGHIEKWLGKTVGAPFAIPDLSTYGLTFEGGRLLVANGKPLAQLMYRHPDGTVIALCLQDISKPPTNEPAFKPQKINGFDFVSWSANGADYVVIGPQGQPDLAAIAQIATLEV